MTARRLEFAAVLTIASPVMCQGLAPTVLGLDASFLRDQEGRPAIPGDQIKGLCRDACKLVFPDQEASLFGPRSVAAGDGLEPQRARLVFSDFVDQRDGAGLRNNAPAIRVEIDDATGSVKDGHLQMVEMIAPPGEDIEFAGRIVAFAGPDEQAKDLERRLLAMLCCIPAVGAFKSVGFGEVKGASLRLLTDGALLRSADGEYADRLGFEATFDRPVLFDAERVEDNVFRGAAVASGAVIKGALATRLARAGMLEAVSASLSRVRISYAFPIINGAALARTLPLSLVRAGEKTRDVLLSEDAAIAAVVDGLAGAFQPDWKVKDGSAAAEAVGWPGRRLEASEQRTRTAVGPAGVAADQQLFVYQAIPSRLDGAPLQWRFEIDRGEGVDDADWGIIASALSGGLDQVGKTDASMLLKPVTPPERPVPRPFARGDRLAWAVTLESPALLVDENGPWDAQAQYQAYWATALGLDEPPQLESFFAAEVIKGGYLALRRRSKAGSYSPWLVTKPGSVFLLSVSRAAGGAMEAALKRALVRGLPVRADSQLGRAPTWQECPYVPENGYGAISLLHDEHERLSASSQAWRREAS